MHRDAPWHALAAFGAAIVLAIVWPAWPGDPRPTAARYVRDATLPVELAPADDGTDAPASNAEPTLPADDSHTTTRPAHAPPQELTDDAVHQVIAVGQQAGDPLLPAHAGGAAALTDPGH